MKVRVKRHDYGDGFDIATFETDAPPRIGEYLRFNDDEEAFFQVVRVIYDLERFGPGTHPDVIVLVTPEIQAPQFHFDIIWQDESERPAWLPAELIIDSDYPLRAGETMTIGLVEPSFVADVKDGKSDGAIPQDRLVTVEIIAVAHASFCQQTDEDRAAGIGFGDLQTELQVRKATINARGDIQRFLARAHRN